MARFESGPAGSLMMSAGVVGDRRPVRSPISTVETKQACGGWPGASSNHSALPVLGWSGRERVEEAALHRPAERGKAVESGERARSKVEAGGVAAAASVDEHHPPPKQGRRDGRGAPEPDMLHHCGDGRVVERHLHRAEQDEAAALGQRARVEDAAEVFGREWDGH